MIHSTKESRAELLLRKIRNSVKEINEAVEKLEKLSEQQEIIRCGECSEWKQVKGKTYRNGNERTCCSFGVTTGRYFFCGDAERRTDE